ncbi:MAG TPA: hypothetical protein PLL64_13555 [Rhodothermales bacterium]|nr:hypothetical protein [Rhodothermales bacterium]HRR08793.1 hypothetical protein [Rhodothermales bacterium]
MRILRWFVWICIFLLVGTWVLARVTGGASRTFPVIAPDAMLHLMGRTQSAAAWAANFRPEFYAAKEKPTEPLLTIWYQVQVQKGQYYFTYHPVWQDETHPIASVDFCYRAWRWAFYGAVADVEALTIRVSSAGPTGIAYETASSDAPYDAIQPKHVRIKESIEASEIPMRFYIRTWNHLLTRQPLRDGIMHQKPALEPLTEEPYRLYKMDRRARAILW